jgi:pyruvate carboxylase subunit B
MASKRVAVMNTAFRDGFQSVFGARVFTKDFIPAVEAARDAGFTHFEAGGGARFQSLYLYCGECAFDMMDAFRAATGPDANLQTLARGVNVVGLDSQSSDVIKLHAVLFKKHGISTIRNFDALNDIRNLTYSGQCIADAGLNHEVVVTMMELPPGCEGAHTPEFYIGVLQNILDSGVPFSSVCFKDASGTAAPSKVYETIKLARKLLPPETHLRVHTHETAGISVITYKAALDAGADGIDLAMAPCSGGTAQPDVATMWHALRGTKYDLGLDITKVMEAEEVFKECMKDYFIPPEAKAVEPLIPFSPMPGGALTANTQMMRDNQMLERYPEVIMAMSEVVRRGGFGTSVTPVSQFYFQQAFNNVIFGPWKRIADGYGKMVLGYFGHTPMPPDPEIVALAQEQLELEPTTDNPREINDRDATKGVAPAQALLKEAGFELTDENTFIAAALGAKGIAYLKGEGTIGVRKNVDVAPAAVASPSDNYRVTVNGETFEVHLDGDRATVSGETYSFTVDASDGSATASGGSTSSGPAVEVCSELPGKVLRLNCKVGDAVKAGDPLLVLEALKMEIPVNSPQDGTVRAVHVSVAQQVGAGASLVSMG